MKIFSFTLQPPFRQGISTRCHEDFVIVGLNVSEDCSMEKIIKD